MYQKGNLMRKKIEIQDLQEITTIVDLLWSEKEEKLILCAKKASLEKNQYENTVYQVDVEKQQIKTLEYLLGKCGFLEDNGKLLYPAILTGEDADYIKNGGYLTVFEEINLDGSEKKEAFKLPLNNPSLSKIDDNNFLVSAVCDIFRPDIESMEGTEKTEALKNWKDEQEIVVCEELPYCSDGRGFIVGKRRRIFVFNRESNTLTPIVGKNFETSAATVNGYKIVFAGIEHMGVRDLSQGLYVYDLHSNQTRTLIEPGKYHFKGLGFLGGKIVAAANAWMGFSSRYGHDIYLIDQQSGEMSCCIDMSNEDFGYNVASDCSFGCGITFAVQNDTLYYITTRRNTCCLCRWTKNTGVEQLTPDSFDAEHFILAGDNVVVSGCRWGELAELYLVKDGDIERLTNLNQNYMNSYNITKPISLQVKNREGLLIDGWVIPPVGYHETKKYPAVLEIHGGPRMIYSAGYYHEKQVLSSMGCFVVSCNPRGSAGRGSNFANLKGVRGTIDYQDIMDYLDGALDAYPQIDSEKLAVTGGSYGGYMTNWIISHTDRFKAAVSCRSNSNITLIPVHHHTCGQEFAIVNTVSCRLGG
jgi:dipeptidyl aminopeptidase/acylaminoacyl peptidase